MSTYGFNPLNSRLFLLCTVKESHEYVNITALIYLEMPAFEYQVELHTAMESPRCQIVSPSDGSYMLWE